MIKKTIYYIFTFLLFIFFISCGNNSNNVTNPTSYNNPATEAINKYTVKGIDNKYNSTWKFFNADSTGNDSVDVVIENGGISGLVISNKTDKVNFDKNAIYSIKEENKNKYYDRYYGYIVSSDNWVGEIQFPTDEFETVGYIYIKNKKTSDIIVGMIDKAPGPREGIDKGYWGKRSRTDNGLKRTVDIQKDFVTYYENDVQKVKIPSKFFELSKGDGFYGYSIMLGLLYPGVSINVYNSQNSSILPSVYFEYIDYNYYLDIQLRDDGVPISAKYNKKETIYSSGDMLYSKEN
ncbi:hypothetical protein [Brachyspira intermedia]|uniref:hypothetical protein n=1 Tax=Brachyspira intermedia TaxID=84377 RepID=UPI003007B406